MARFYGSPLMGAWLQQHLMPKDIHSMRHFFSQHGVTKKIFEPHEFGFFWASHLDFNSNCHEPENKKEIESIDFSFLNNILKDISIIFHRPVVYKCSISPFIINTFLKHTDVFFIHITRNKKTTIDSILRVREQRLGDKTKWWSIRPLGWDGMNDKSPEQQIAWQYDRVISSIQKGSIGYESRVCEVSLEELTKDPESILDNIMSLYGCYSGADIAKVGTPIKFLSDRVK